MHSVVWMIMGPTDFCVSGLFGKDEAWLEVGFGTSEIYTTPSQSLCASCLWIRVESQLPLQQHSFLLAAVVPAVTSMEWWVWTKALKLWARLQLTAFFERLPGSRCLFISTEQRLRPWGYGLISFFFNEYPDFPEFFVDESALSSVYLFSDAFFFFFYKKLAANM